MWIHVPLPCLILTPYVGLMHTLFALEDMYGLKIKDIDGELCLCLDKSNTSFSSFV